MSRIGRALISSDDSTGAVTLPSAPTILPTIQGGFGIDMSTASGPVFFTAGVATAISTIVDVAGKATGGTGTAVSPWTGWDTAITWTYGTYFFRQGVFSAPNIALVFNASDQGVFTFQGCGKARVTKTGSTIEHENGTVLRFTKADGTDAIKYLATAFQQDFIVIRDMTIVGPDTSATATSGNGVNVDGGTTPAIPIVELRNVRITYFGGGSALRLDHPEECDLLDVELMYSDIGLEMNGACNANALIDVQCGYNRIGTQITDSQSNSFVNYYCHNSEESGLVLLGGVSNCTFVAPHFEGNNSTAAAGEGAIKSNAAAGLNFQITLLTPTFSSTTDKIVTTGGSSQNSHRAWKILGGRTASVGIPKITLETWAYDWFIDETCEPTNVTDSGKRNLIRWLGATVDANTIGVINGYGIDVAQDADVSLGTDTLQGRLIVLNDIGHTGEFTLKGGYQAVNEVQDEDTQFSVTKDNAGTTNVYWDAGTSTYRLQNKETGTHTYRVHLIGYSG